MAAITGTVLAAAGTAYAADQQKKAAQGAANSVNEAQGAALASNQANMTPYLDAGSNALSQLQQLNNGNYASFNESPDYQFTLNQGLQGLDRSAAARGSLYSGGQQADVLNYASGLASQQYNNYYNKLAGLAGMGQSAAGALAGVNTGYANAVGNANANAAYATGDANSSLAGALTGLGTNLLNQYATSQPQSTRTSSWGSFAPTTNYNSLSTLNPGNGSYWNFG